MVNARFVKPFDRDAVRRLAGEYRLVVTMEENVCTGGFGEQVRSYLASEGIHTPVLRAAIPDMFVEQGGVGELYRMLGIDAAGIAEKIIHALESGRE